MVWIGTNSISLWGKTSSLSLIIKCVICSYYFLWKFKCLIFLTYLFVYHDETNPHQSSTVWKCSSNSFNSLTKTLVCGSGSKFLIVYISQPKQICLVYCSAPSSLHPLHNKPFLLSWSGAIFKDSILFENSTNLWSDMWCFK